MSPFELIEVREVADRGLEWIFFWFLILISQRAWQLYDSIWKDVAKRWIEDIQSVQSIHNQLLKICRPKLQHIWGKGKKRLPSYPLKTGPPIGVYPLPPHLNPNYILVREQCRCLGLSVSLCWAYTWHNWSNKFLTNLSSAYPSPSLPHPSTPPPICGLAKLIMENTYLC